MGQIAQRFFVAYSTHPFLFNEGVEVVGKGGNFGGVDALHFGLLTTFNAGNF